jgi:hypothetical protein
LQSCSDGALGVILVSAWKPKIGKHPIAEKLGDVAVVAPNRIAAEALEFVQNLAQILWVELRRQGCGTDQVIERNSQVPPLGPEVLAGTRTLVSRHFWRRETISWDRSQEPFAMPKGHAKRGEILLSQICQGLAINIIFREHLGVTVKAEARKPLAQVAHARAEICSDLYHYLRVQTRKRRLVFFSSVTR